MLSCGMGKPVESLALGKATHCIAFRWHRKLALFQAKNSCSYPRGDVNPALFLLRIKLVGKDS